MSCGNKTNNPAQPPPARPTTEAEIAEIRRFIAPFSSQLSTRALPNQRLARVFNITNAFTTSDPQVKNAFRHEAIARLNRVAAAAPPSAAATKREEDLTRLRDWAVRAVTEYLTIEGSRGSVNLADMCQFVTLQFSAQYLFHASDPSDWATADPGLRDAISRVGKGINDLWILSKDATTTLLWADQREMHAALAILTGCSPSSPPPAAEANPLNWLLPAYETMWRVVMRCLLEVHVRPTPPRRDTWSSALAQFLNTPTQEAFQNRGLSLPSQYAVSTLDIVKEGLRLYPPTRHVHRQAGPGAPVLSADIQAAHRSPLLAPVEPLQYSPSRWADIERDALDKRQASAATAVEESCNEKDHGIVRADPALAIKKHEEKLGFMPFAFVCPAGGAITRGFGLKAIGLLVAALQRGLDEGGWEVDECMGEEVEGVEKGPLRGGRTDYLDVWVTKPQSESRAEEKMDV